MGIFDALLGGGAKGVGELVKDVVSTFHLSPEAKAEIDAKVEENKLALAKLDAELQEAVLKHDTDIQTQAAETIRAEATSEDPFVRRARPAFLWVMTSAIGISLIVFPLINTFTGKGLTFVQIPDAYLQLFGVGFLGYTAARSYEKVAGSK
jgi:hypothetical protein